MLKLNLASQAVFQPEVLQMGSRGLPVLKLQNRLQDLGYYDGSIDGLFGPATRSAVAAFQSAQALEPDGIVQVQTWIELMFATSPQLVVNLEVLPLPRLSEIDFTQSAPPPSPVWLLIMPLVPLLGGLLAFVGRGIKPQRSQ